MVPLAWACRAAGHEVVVASQPGLTAAIGQTGLPAAPVGTDVDALATFREIAMSPQLAQPGRGGPRVMSLLAALADSMAADLAALARQWRADLIVSDPTALAGPLAAAAAGVPVVRHLYGTDLMSAAGQFISAAIRPLAARLGVDSVAPFGAATIDPYPAGLQVSPTGSRRLPMRYMPYNGAGVLPAEAGRPASASRPGRPRVCVTWGTTLSRLDPEFFLAGSVARAIADVDAEIMIAVTPEQRELLGALPPHAHVVESAPLGLLLPDCDLVIAHGGAGTILTSIAHGLPLLLVPRLPDHSRHAARIAATGAGLVIPASASDSSMIRDQAAELLEKPGYRAMATKLRWQLRAQPAPAQVVHDLEEIVRTAGV